MSSKEKILKAASELFYHVGYQTTTVDDILARCRVAKSNFYYHFKSKEEVAQEVLALRIAEYRDLLVLYLHNPACSPTERIESLFESLCSVQSELRNFGGCPIGNFVASLPTRTENLAHEQFRQSVSDLFRHMEASLRDCLEEGIRQGDFRSDISCESMAYFLVAAIQGMMMLTKTHQDTHALYKGLKTACRLIKMP